MVVVETVLAGHGDLPLGLPCWIATHSWKQSPISVRLSPRKRAALAPQPYFPYSITRSRTRDGHEVVDSVDKFGWRRADVENWRPDRCVMAPHHTARDCTCEACTNLSLSPIHVIPQTGPRRISLSIPP